MQTSLIQLKSIDLVSTYKPIQPKLMGKYYYFLILYEFARCEMCNNVRFFEKRMNPTPKPGV